MIPFLDLAPFETQVLHLKCCRVVFQLLCQIMCVLKVQSFSFFFLIFRSSEETTSNLIMLKWLNGKQSSCFYGDILNIFSNRVQRTIFFSILFQRHCIFSNQIMRLFGPILNIVYFYFLIVCKTLLQKLSENSSREVDMVHRTAQTFFPA